MLDAQRIYCTSATQEKPFDLFYKAPELGTLFYSAGLPEPYKVFGISVRFAGDRRKAIARISAEDRQMCCALMVELSIPPL